MVALIRAVLIWLLILALPAQGAAAATMAFCNPNHHLSGSPGVSSQTGKTGPGLATKHHVHLHADAGDLAQHAHRYALLQGSGDFEHAVSSANSDAASETSGSTAHLSIKKLAHAEKHKCSACASCCSAAIVGSNVLNVPAADVTPAVFIAVVPAVEKFSSDGPDRPPRVLIV